MSFANSPLPVLSLTGNAGLLRAEAIEAAHGLPPAQQVHGDRQSMPEKRRRSVSGGPSDSSARSQKEAFTPSVH